MAGSRPEHWRWPRESRVLSPLPLPTKAKSRPDPGLPPREPTLKQCFLGWRDEAVLAMNSELQVTAQALSPTWKELTPGSQALSPSRKVCVDLTSKERVVKFEASPKATPKPLGLENEETTFRFS
ncbi:unnamed protein product [Effrenium voratum]|nr:unnamed protein product [Effrenium voratum]